MNWLAHIFLSEYNIDFQIANYLADPLKGKLWESANEDLKKGIKTHFLIDSFTDKNEIVKLSKSRLRNKGLLRAIVIDICYDYFLYKNWNTYCNLSHKDFTSTFYKEATNQLNKLPNKASIPLKQMIKYKILDNYKSIEQLQIALERIDKRLSQRVLKKDTTSSYFNSVVQNIEELEKDFSIFFPQICKFIKKNTDNSKLTHWKI